MKTIICGGRDYMFTVADCAWLDRIHAQTPITQVVCGGATGADTCGKSWAKNRGIPVWTIIADWRTHGKAAGPMRNQQMADYAEACVAFPGGRGTADMLSKATAKGLKLFLAPSFPVRPVLSDG